MWCGCGVAVEASREIMDYKRIYKSGFVLKSLRKHRWTRQYVAVEDATNLHLPANATVMLPPLARLDLTLLAQLHFAFASPSLTMSSHTHTTAAPRPAVPRTDPALFTCTDHDDAHTQARSGDPPPPVGPLPRDRERGEWSAYVRECSESVSWRGGHAASTRGCGRGEGWGEQGGGDAGDAA